MEQPIGLEVRLNLSFEAALEAVTGALQKEGFGVLTRIDVPATFKDKLGKDFRPFVILGACNPPLAHAALSNDARVGLFLPCNVVVEQRQDGVWASLVNPEVMLGVGSLAQNPELRRVASDARARFERVASSLQQA